MFGRGPSLIILKINSSQLIPFMSGSASLCCRAGGGAEWSCGDLGVGRHRELYGLNGNLCHFEQCQCACDSSDDLAVVDNSRMNFLGTERGSVLFRPTHV